MYTVESVLKGHPDKICDQISDGLLDAYLKADSNSHTAIECLGTGNTLIVAGEIRSNAVVDIEESCMRIYSDITGNPKINVIICEGMYLVINLGVRKTIKRHTIERIKASLLMFCKQKEICFILSSVDE